MRLTAQDFINRKSSEKIVVLTAYTYNFAKILDSHCDILLVGDSVGMVMYGMESTIPVTLDMMINHGKAVVKGSEKSLIVVDMPFGTYENSKEIALQNAKRIIYETGCQAVKLEGGQEMAETIKYLVDNNIPVMSHIGLLPQSVEKMGGYAIQGKTPESENNLIEDAKAVEEAGAFAIVIEGVKKQAADKINNSVNIPTIGIGASEACDGQVLVTEDMLGITDNPPKFVKKYANLKEIISESAKLYSDEVKSSKFPTSKNTY